MNGSPQTTEANEPRNGLWFIEVRPAADHAQELTARLSRGETPRLEIAMEVVDICSDGRALIWIPDLGRRKGRAPRMTAARLSPLRTAEVVAARSAGYAPCLRLHLEVIGPTPDGFGAVTGDPDGVLEFGVRQDAEDVSVLIGPQNA